MNVNERTKVELIVEEFNKSLIEQAKKIGYKPIILEFSKEVEKGLVIKQDTIIYPDYETIKDEDGGFFLLFEGYFDLVTHEVLAWNQHREKEYLSTGKRRGGKAEKLIRKQLEEEALLGWPTEDYRSDYCDSPPYIFF